MTGSWPLTMLIRGCLAHIGYDIIYVYLAATFLSVYVEDGVLRTIS